MAARIAMAVVACLLASVQSALASQPTKPVVVTKAQPMVAVDPRMELFSIIFRLAGFREYSQADESSAYIKAVAEHFGPFREHPVVQATQKLRAQFGVSYNAPMSLALHLDDAEHLKLIIPMAKHPTALDDRWGKVDVEAFLVLVRDFAKKSDFVAFFGAHKSTYQKWVAAVKSQLQVDQVVAWLGGLTGQKALPEVVIYLSAINGGANYGTSVVFPDGREQLAPVYGLDTFDSNGLPVLGDSWLELVVHELSHPYMNPLVAAFSSQLEGPVAGLLARRLAEMSSVGYTTWDSLANETLVRGIVMLYLADYGSKKQMQENREEDLNKGFLWIPDFAQLLKAFVKDRKQYPTLEAFMPRVVEFFDQVLQQEKKFDPERPKVIKINPLNGAKDVDPALRVITIEFDRPMREGSWSFVGSGKKYPTLGVTVYDSTQKILTVPIQLQPNWSYHFSLNGGRYQSFASAKGVPLWPISIEFLTRGAESP